MCTVHGVQARAVSCTCHQSSPASLPRVREKSAPRPGRQAHGRQAICLEQTSSAWERLVGKPTRACMCLCRVRTGCWVREGCCSEGRASHFPSFLHSYLLRNLSRLKLLMAYVECLLRAGHGTGLHAENQEEGTLIPAIWLDLCVPRWCPGPLVFWAKRSAKRWCPGPRGVP